MFTERKTLSDELSILLQYMTEGSPEEVLVGSSLVFRYVLAVQIKVKRFLQDLHAARRHAALH